MLSRLQPARALRFVEALLIAGALIAGSSVHAAIRSERLLAAILQQTPDSTLVAAGEQWKSAEVAAAEIPGAFAFWGVGRSMEPLFADGTAIVVAPIRFKELTKGMTVVYMSRAGRMVAHSLTGDVPKGWIAQGLNNDQEDDDLVTRENLIGVIVQAFSEMPSDFRVALTNQLVASGRLVRGS